MNQINITEIDVGGPETESLVLEALRSGRLASGPLVERLEDGFAAYIGVDHVIAVNNGTTALVAAIEASGIGPGDEVITSPFTFVATVNAILEAGAVARFADIGDDFNLDPAKVESLIGPATKAIMPVHLYGQCADMAPFMALAAEHGLAVIEDAAQAHGATYRGACAGTFGVGCFSLYATKNMTTGEGGFVTTNDADLADRVRVLRNQGMRARYQYEVAGHNWRLTDIQAAIGIPQLATLDDKVAARRSNAAYLTNGLAGIDGLQTPVVMESRGHVWHQYTVRVDPASGVTRDDLAERLTEHKVGSGIYYPKVVYDYDCYRGNPSVIPGAVPNAFAAAEQVLSLPVHPNLDADDLDRVISSVRSTFD